MGWSCAAAAHRTLDEWQRHCHRVTKSSNGYYGPDGAEYFFESSRTEHADGAITGAAWKICTLDRRCRKAGSWRIEGNGRVTRWPAGLRAAMAA